MKRRGFLRTVIGLIAGIFPSLAVMSSEVGVDPAIMAEQYPRVRESDEIVVRVPRHGWVEQLRLMQEYGWTPDEVSRLTPQQAQLFREH